MYFFYSQLLTVDHSFWKYETWQFLYILPCQLLIRQIFPIVSAGYCGGVQCFHIIWQVFVSLFFWYKKSMTQHSSLCLQVKELSHLTLLPRNQSHNSNTLLHFSASHLFLLSSPSPFHSTSSLICLHPSSLRLLHMPLTLTCQEPASRDDITWYFYYPKLERVRCQRSSAVLTFDFEQGIGLSLEYPQQQ